MGGRKQYDDSTPPASRHDHWGVVLDAPDPETLAQFYAELLDWRIVQSEPDWIVTAPPAGVATLAVQRSPTYERPIWPNAPGKQQQMLHLDIEVEDLEAAVRHATELGAEPATFQPLTHGRVMLDPVGHPFCLYVVQSA